MLSLCCLIRAVCSHSVLTEGVHCYSIWRRSSWVWDVGRRARVCPSRSSGRLRWYVRLGHGSIRRRDLILIAGEIGFFALPWLVYRTAVGIGSEYFAGRDAPGGEEIIRRLPVIASAIGSRLLKVTGPLNALFYVYLAALLLRLRHLATSPAPVVHALIAFQLTAYVAIYAVTPYEIRWHLSTFLSRLLLHVAPLALLTAGVHT